MRRVWYAVCTFLILIAAYVLFYASETHETHREAASRTIELDGLCVMHDSCYLTDESRLHQDALRRLPEGYVFVDYLYEIRDNSLPTFHRDVTSSMRVMRTRLPVYTLILYLSRGPMLSVCPGSHRTYPFTWSRVVNIDGEPGTAFLFDCDVLHAGRVACAHRRLVQYKICHRGDLEALASLRGIRKHKGGGDCARRPLLRTASYFFSAPLTLAAPLMIRKAEPSSLTGAIQAAIRPFIPLDFYNNA
jgi:hypothetical protein